MQTEAVAAASLILVRELPGGMELLMVERSPSMAFAPGALVFPGGKIDPEDRAMADRHACSDAAARIAAIRETLEEAGIAAALSPSLPAARARRLQQGLLSGVPFATLIAEEGVELDLESLTPFARWVPGHRVARRFDASFFIAWKDAAGLVPHVASSECIESRWLSAAALLELESRGLARLLYPTRKILERIAQFDRFADLLDDAWRYPVTKVSGTIEMRGGKAFVTLPEGIGYPITCDPLKTVWRG